MMRRYRAVSVVAVALLAHGPAVVGADGTLPTEAVKAIDANDWRAVEKILKPLAKEPGGEAINYWLGFARYSRNDKDARWALLGALAARPTSIANARMVARCGQLFAADHRLPKFIAATADTYSFDADVQHFVGMTWAKRYLYDLKIQSRIVKRDPGQSLGNAIFHLERAHELGTTRPNNAGSPTSTTCS